MNKPQETFFDKKKKTVVKIIGGKLFVKETKTKNL